MTRAVVPGATAPSPAYRTVSVPAVTFRSAPLIANDADQRPRDTPTRCDTFTVRPRTLPANVIVSRPLAVMGSVPLTRRRVRSSRAARTRGVPSARAMVGATCGAAVCGASTTASYKVNIIRFGVNYKFW